MDDKNAGGRPMLDPGGGKRKSVRVAGTQYKGMKLSMLPEQAEFLERVGDGNRSKGFRRVIALLSHAAEMYDLLVMAAESYEDQAASSDDNPDRLENWLKELDGILEHGRESTEDDSDVGGSDS